MLIALLFADALTGLPQVDFDLANLAPVRKDCSAPSADDIVVCARKRLHDPNRITTGPAVIDALPKAEIAIIGNVRGSLNARQSSVGGFTSNQMMATITIPF